MDIKKVLLVTMMVMILALTSCTKANNDVEESNKEPEVSQELEQEEEKMVEIDLVSEEVLEQLKGLGFDDSEKEAYLKYDKETQPKCIVYKERVTPLEIHEFDTKVITDNNTKVGMVLLSRMGCPKCVEYVNKDYYPSLANIEGVKYSYLHTRGEVYADEAVRNILPVNSVPSTVFFNKDGSLLTANELNEAKLTELGIRYEVLENSEGLKILAFLGYPTVEDVKTIVGLMK